jgi:hypothetical protein
MLLHKRAGRMIAGVGLLVIAVMTLTPNFAAGTQRPSLCLICGQRGGEDVLLNVLLFVPFAFGLRLQGAKRWRAWAVTIATTASIETLQIFIPGRDATLSDVLTNSIGGIGGILLCDSLQLWLFPTVRQAKWLLLSGSVLWLMLVALGGWAMRPWLPSGPYFAQLAPDLEHIELFEGRVVDAQVNGRAIVPNAVLANSEAIRDGVLRGSLTLRARVIPAQPTYDLAPIVSIASARESEVVVLGQDWRDAVLRVRLHSGELRMNIPEVAAARVFPVAVTPPLSGASADTIELQGQVLGGRRLTVSYASRETRKVAELALNPFLLWSLATPGKRRSPRAFEIESMLWVAMLLAPLGYWTGRWKFQSRVATESRVLRAMPEILLTASSVLGLAAIPLIFEFPVARTPLWIAAAVATGGAHRFGTRWRRSPSDFAQLSTR